MIEYGQSIFRIIFTRKFRSIEHWEKVLEKAAGILNCDLDYIRHSRRISRSLKNDRDLLVYLVWKICILGNEETGRLFGMTYSAISHILGSMRTRMQKDSELRVKYNNAYSLCKM